MWELLPYWLLDSVLQAAVTAFLWQSLGKHLILCFVFLTLKILSGTHVRTGHWKCASSAVADLGEGPGLGPPYG